MEAAHHPWPVLGALFVREGLVRTDELESALERRASGLRLGVILVERGIVTRTQVARVLAEQQVGVTTADEVQRVAGDWNA